MSDKFAYLYVLDTLADWEPGYLTAELNSGQNFAEPGTSIPVRTVGATGDPVTTMGGLRVSPDLTLDELDPANAALLVLPGSDIWLQPGQEAVLAAARGFLDAGVPVAAICGATAAMANAGMLDDRPHTSNDLGFLQAVCPEYRGAAHYRDEPVVTDGNLITASGVAPVHFAHAVLGKLQVFRPEALDAWLRLNRDREPQAFYDLMAALPEQPASV